MLCWLFCCFKVEKTLFGCIVKFLYSGVTGSIIIVVDEFSFYGTGGSNRSSVVIPFLLSLSLCPPSALTCYAAKGWFISRSPAKSYLTVFCCRFQIMLSQEYTSADRLRDQYHLAVLSPTPLTCVVWETS